MGIRMMSSIICWNSIMFRRLALRHALISGVRLLPIVQNKSISLPIPQMLICSKVRRRKCSSMLRSVTFNILTTQDRSNLSHVVITARCESAHGSSHAVRFSSASALPPRDGCRRPWCGSWRSDLQQRWKHLCRSRDCMQCQ